VRITVVQVKKCAGCKKNHSARVIPLRVPQVIDGVSYTGIFICKNSGREVYVYKEQTELLK
jgi:hypothetical protein